MTDPRPTSGLANAGPRPTDRSRAIPLSELEAPAARSGSTRFRLGTTLLVLAIYAGCAVAGFWDAWAHGPAQYASSGGGDQAVSMWFLVWAPFALLHGHNPLFSNYANYPFGVNMLVNTSTLAVGILVMPVTLLWGPVVSFNVVGTLAPFLSAWAAYVLARRFTTWKPAAFFAGLLYGFSPYIVAEGVGHVMTVFVPLPPLIFLLLHDIVVRQPGRPVARGLLLAVLLIVQFFVSLEVLLGTVVMSAVVVVVSALVGRREVREKLKYAATAFVTAAVCSLAALAYPLWFLVRGPAHVVGAVQQAPQVYRADLLGPIYPDALQRFAPHALQVVSSHFAGNGSENGSYLGLPLVIFLLIAGVMLRRRPVALVAFVSGLIAFVLSLGSHLTVANHVTSIPLPEGIFDKIPLLQDALPVRFSLYVALAAGLLLAIALDRLRVADIWRHRPIAAIGAPLVLAGATLLPLVPAWPYALAPVAIPAFFSSRAELAVRPGDAALVYPYSNALFANPQLWQATTFLRFKLPGGRFNVPQPVTGRSGPTRSSLTDTVLSKIAAGQPVAQTRKLRHDLVTQLRSWHIHDVIVVPGPDTARAESFLAWVLGRPARKLAGAEVWLDWR